LRRCLPDFGQIFGFRSSWVHDRRVYVDPRLVQRVQETTGLAPAEAGRLVEDVLAFHDETVEEWVRRRHREMKTYGARNDEIFTQLRADLAGLVVAAPALSERQLRRIIYG
jgi:hypothetical protein